MFQRVCRFDIVATLPALRGYGAALRNRCRRGLCLRLITTAAIAITLNLNAVTISNAYNLSAKQIDWVLVAYNHLGGDLYENK